MPVYRRSSASWTTIRNIYRKASGSWVQINAVYRRANGSWNRVFSRVTLPSIQSPVTISKSTNGTTFLVTLTGTNYFWSQSPTSLSYRFQWSSNGGSSWSDISTGTATNPSSGSSNTYTYSVPTSEVAANVNNLYRFSVTATNSAGGATSTSSNLSYAEIQGPTDVSDLSVTSTGSNSASLSWSASTGASAYLLYYATTPPSYTLGQTVVGATSGTISGLSGGTSYYFRILPITGTSNTYKGYSGNFSNVVTGTTTALPSPPTITSFSATTSSITLNFTAGANSTSTRAYVNGNFDGSTTGSSYTFLGLSANTTYTLALFGYNGVVQSTTSSGGNYTTNKNPALTPTFGANTSVTGGFTGSVTNYDANYTWGISTNSGSVSWGTISGNVRTFTVSGLSAGASATVTVTTSRTNYFDGSAQTTGSASANVAPTGGSVSISLISGTIGRVGAVYSASVTNASGTPTPTFTYQWRRSLNYSPFSSSNIGSGASTYTSTYDDVDSQITCIVTFTNAAGSQTATSNGLQVSPPTITSITAVTTNNTAPYVTWTINGYNIQSSQGTVIYGSTTPPSIISGTNPQANAGLTRSTNSRSGTTANYYRFNNVRAFSGLSQTGRPSPSVSAITTTTIVRANAAATITVYP